MGNDGRGKVSRRGEGVVIVTFVKGRGVGGGGDRESELGRACVCVEGVGCSAFFCHRGDRMH